MKRLRLFPDFVFLDDHGTPHALRDVLGDFTVLFFTRSANARHGSTLELISAVVTENRSGLQMDVRGIIVHSPDAPCDQHRACHLVDAAAGVLVLSDPTGAIRRLYGVGHQDRLFVIGPNRHVIDTALDCPVERLHPQLNLDVALWTDGAARRPFREPRSGRARNLRQTARQETPDVRFARDGSRGNASDP